MKLRDCFEQIGFLKWIVLVAGTLGAILFALYMNLNKVIVTEAGQNFDAKSIWLTEIKLPIFMEDIVDTNTLGTQECTINICGLYRTDITIEVVDSVAPSVMTRSVTLHYGEGCKVEDFIVSGEDFSEISYAFLNNIDYEHIGRQEVAIQAVDACGNWTTVYSEVVIQPIYALQVIEMGDPLPEASSFVVEGDLAAEYVTTPAEGFSKVPGEYPVEVRIDGQVERLMIQVIDNVAPIIEVQDRKCYSHKTLSAEDFLVSVVDDTQTVASFKNAPDFTKEGVQEVIIVVTDEAGNHTEATAMLTVEKDTVGPNISTVYIKVMVNTSLSYKKNIYISDNCDDASELKMEIDNSGVDLSTVGNYVVVCTVTDTAGNSTSKEITIQVVETATDVHTQEEIDAYADEILARILTEGMSLRDKAYAIYRYTRSNIGYVSEAQQTDWLYGAYEGMVKHQGNCFTYAATAKALLERIGLEPIHVQKEKESWTSQSNHHWLLVDLGEGYYHFDPTPRVDGVYFFMWTDAQILEYSNNHRGSHNFTRDLYPDIQ